MKMMVDTHTHFSHRRFDKSREDILPILRSHGIHGVIEAAITIKSNYTMKSLCERFPNVFMAVACHPNCVLSMDKTAFNELEQLAQYEKVVAIGETGLDYDRGASVELMEKQREWFEEFIKLALEVKKPLIIHSREANEALIKILSRYKTSFSEYPGVVHCFNGSEADAEALLDIGLFLGVNGMFTKMDKESMLCQAIKKVPLERLLLETDCPFLRPEGAPEDYINSPLNLQYVVAGLAELREENPEHIRKVIWSNTQKVFPGVFEEK